MDKHPKPTGWNVKDKCQLLEISPSCLRVMYKDKYKVFTLIGGGKSEGDAATVRANHSISPSCGIFYFEVHIISKGRDGYIGIGICTAIMPLTRLPGWERNTFGYHGDDGNLFKGSGVGKMYGPTFTTGDVIGCCVNYIQNSLFFTKNGIPLAEATSEIKGIYYPCVGLRTPGEIVEANFGELPFMFDFEQFKKDERRRVMLGLESISYMDGHMAASGLVLSYLIHHGYSRTVRAFARDSGSGQSSALETQLLDISNRQSVCLLLRNGQIDSVISELNRVYPDFLQKRQDILFKLLCQKFVEMIKFAPIEETMVFGQTQLYKFDAIYKKELEEVFALLAYVDPLQCPMSYLLDEKRREPIENDLNCALLVHTNRPAVPQLEVVLQQTSAVMDEVVAQGAGPAAVFMNPQEFINEGNKM